MIDLFFQVMVIFPSLASATIWTASNPFPSGHFQHPYGFLA